MTRSSSVAAGAEGAEVGAAEEDGVVAIKDGDPALLLRLYAAAKSLKGIRDKTVRTRASRMVRKMKSRAQERR